MTRQSTCSSSPVSAGNADRSDSVLSFFPMRKRMAVTRPANKRYKPAGQSDRDMRVCHNAHIERFTPATDNCSRGDFFK